ncbi:aldolase catalytic domain-containing protein [Thermoproteota archaeon]
MFRKDIEVLDCTIRDGGLINNWDFTDSFVKAVFRALHEAGIDYMEVGYKSSRSLLSPEGIGKWRFCDEEVLRPIVEETHMKLSAMIDVGRVDPGDIPQESDSVLNMIRVATYVKDIDKAIDLAKRMHDKGYETTVNIMAISHARDQELDEALIQLSESPVSTVYIVDSFGSLYSEQVKYLVEKYKTHLKGKKVGMHAHNNQQLGFGNTIEAIIHGASMLDATVYGIGRGAGNCPIELLIGFLKNPKFNIRPIIKLIEDEFIPLREKIEWGYLIPYALTGIRDEHPRAAMKLRKTEAKDCYTKFYDSLLNDQVK